MNIGSREIARIGLGTNRLRHTPEHVVFIRQAVEAGIQMIDTAHLYSSGESEAAIGEALGRMRAECMVATKGGYDGASPDVLRSQIEASFKRLRRERVDLYYLHRVDPETPIERSLETIGEYVRSGRIRHVGVSKVDIPLIKRAMTVLPIAAVQNQYNLSERGDDVVVDYCAAHGIAYVPYYPLHGGAGAIVSEIAARHSASLHQVLLAWLLRRSAAMLPIPGTLSLEHVKENLSAIRLQLTDAEFAAIASDASLEG